MTAAALSGGVLALVVPTVAVTTGAANSTTADAALRLASDRRAVAPPPVVRLTPGTADGSLQPSVLPVAEDEPSAFDMAGVLKAAGLADVARKAEDLRKAREASIGCGAPLGGLGRVKPWVRTAAAFLSCLFGEPQLIGVASRASSYSDHPGGLAVDFMVNRATGDDLAACALRNQTALGIDYVIWRQRINYGDGNGWDMMEDRGGSTANHYDHVHISFLRTGTAGRPLTDLCL